MVCRTELLELDTPSRRADIRGGGIFASSGASRHLFFLSIPRWPFWQVRIPSLASMAEALRFRKELRDDRVRDWRCSL